MGSRGGFKTIVFGGLDQHNQVPKPNLDGHTRLVLPTPPPGGAHSRAGPFFLQTLAAPFPRFLDMLLRADTRQLLQGSAAFHNVFAQRLENDVVFFQHLPHFERSTLEHRPVRVCVEWAFAQLEHLVVLETHDGQACVADGVQDVRRTKRLNGWWSNAQRPDLSLERLVWFRSRFLN